MVAAISRTVYREDGVFFSSHRLLIKAILLMTLFSPFRSVRVEVTFEAADTETMIFFVGLLISCSSILWISKLPSSSLASTLMLS